MKKMEPGVQTYFEWIAENISYGSKVGVDPSQVSSGNLIKLISTSI